MFGRLTDLLNNVTKLDEQKIFLEIVSQQGVQAFILSLNLTDQLFVDGVNSDGESLGEYTSYTADNKAGEPYTVEKYTIDDLGFVQVENISKSVSEGDSYTLLDKGELYGNYKVVIDGGGFTLSANTNKKDGDKTVNLESVYGKIVGLNEKSKSELAEAVIPLVVNEVRRVLLS